MKHPTDYELIEILGKSKSRMDLDTARTLYAIGFQAALNGKAVVAAAPTPLQPQGDPASWEWVNDQPTTPAACALVDRTDWSAA